MSKSAFEIVQDVKDIYVEHSRDRATYASDMGAPPLKRRTPKPTKQQPEQRPNNTRTND